MTYGHRRCSSVAMFSDDKVDFTGTRVVCSGQIRAVNQDDNVGILLN